MSLNDKEIVQPISHILKDPLSPRSIYIIYSKPGQGAKRIMGNLLFEYSMKYEIPEGSGNENDQRHILYITKNEKDASERFGSVYQTLHPNDFKGDHVSIEIISGISDPIDILEFIDDYTIGVFIEQATEEMKDFFIRFLSESDSELFHMKIPIVLEIQIHSNRHVYQATPVHDECISRYKSILDKLKISIFVYTTEGCKPENED